MRLRNKKQLFLSILVGSAFLLSTELCSASMVHLYEQPDVKSKIVGDADTDIGLIAIFTPKGSEWMKVGDPRNGNVGWIKLKELTNAGATSEFTFSQKIISSGKGGRSYHMIQFGTPETLTPEQSQAMVKKIQDQQRAIQQDTERMMHDIYQNMNQTWQPSPIYVPVIVVAPEKTQTHSSAPAKTPVQKQ